MGFTDALKRSLGFEEDTSLHNKQQNNYRRPSTPSSDFRMSNNNASDLSSHSYYDDVSISPEQSFYEIMLIRPKTIDDINYDHLEVTDDKPGVTVTHKVYHEVNEEQNKDQYWILYIATDAVGKTTKKVQKIEFNKKPDESQVEDFTKLAEDRKN